MGNHSLFALDGWVLGPLLLKELDRFPRGLGDKFLFANDRIADFILKRGAVMGHPEVCSALMRAGEDLIVFPGGAHEAVKPASMKYELQWKERYGFVKLAAKHGYTIMPFGLVGPDEFYGHLMEGADIPDSALGSLLKRLGLLTEDTRSDMLPPIPVGALGSFLPKPQRCYLGFGQPINLARYKGRTPTRKEQQEHPRRGGQADRDATGRTAVGPGAAQGRGRPAAAPALALVPARSQSRPAPRPGSVAPFLAYRCTNSGERLPRQQARNVLPPFKYLIFIAIYFNKIEHLSRIYINWHVPCNTSSEASVTYLTHWRGRVTIASWPAREGGPLQAPSRVHFTAPSRGSFFCTLPGIDCKFKRRPCLNLMTSSL